MASLPPIKHNKSKVKPLVQQTTLSPIRSAFRITLFYMIFGIVWIVVSDSILEALTGENHELYTHLQTFKGWFYVFITAIYLYFLVVRTLSLYEDAKAKVQSAKDDLQNQYEKTLHSEQRFDLAVKGSFDSIWEYDGLNAKYFMSDAILRVLGYPSKQFKLKTLDDWVAYIALDDREQFLEQIKTFTVTPTEIFEASYRVKRYDGTDAWVRTRGSSQIDPDGKILKVAGSHTDITLSVEHQDALTKIAYYDQLTGLLNWHGFDQFVSERIISKPDQPFTLLYLDIDDFKNINDVHGYSIGDKVLIEVASNLSSLKVSEVLANLGGDGFGFIIESCQRSHLLEHIANIYTTLSKIMAIDGRMIEINACIGVAQYPKDDHHFSELMQCAGEAMYEAKAKGKNTYVFFTNELHQSHLDKIDLINQLRKAVEKNEFSMVYQPVYKLSDMTFSSLEALLRWQPSGRRNIAPDVFIPLAENSGLIGKIELWVFEAVFKQIVAWRKIARKPIPVAINLSSKGITDENFVKTIIELMRIYQIQAGEIEIEITETSLIQHTDEALANLKLLNDQGIKILLDDFGKGYSSLTYLVSLPVDLIKIDRAFTQKIHRSKEIDAVISAIINLAHSINMKVVAEGIEFENQKEFYRSLGADYGQGYLLHYPASVKDIEQLLK